MDETIRSQCPSRKAASALQFNRPVCKIDRSVRPMLIELYMLLEKCHEIKQSFRMVQPVIQS